jgi:hypothetical protein
MEVTMPLLFSSVLWVIKSGIHDVGENGDDEDRRQRFGRFLQIARGYGVVKLAISIARKMNEILVFILTDADSPRPICQSDSDDFNHTPVYFTWVFDL